MATPLRPYRGVSRFPAGVSTAAKFSTLYDMGAQDPTKIHQEFCDFTGLDYVAAQWTVTETQATATQNLQASDAAGEYGILRQALTAGVPAIGDLSSIQLTTVPLFLDTTTGKRWWMKARISRDNADATIGVGVQAVNATPFTVANGIWVSITGASTDIVFRIAKASAASTATVTAGYPTSALNTFVTVGMMYDPKAQEVKCFVNDVQKGTISVATTNNIPIVGLTPTISVQNTTANARNMDTDYILFAVER